MIEALNEFIKNNSIITTFIGGGAIVTFFVYLRSILSAIIRAINACISFSIIGRYDCTYCTPESMERLLKVIEQKGKVLWSRRSEIVSGEVERASDTERIVPHGFGLYLLYGKLVYISKEFDTTAKSLYTTIVVKVYFSRKATFSAKLLEDLSKVVLRGNEDKITVRTGSGGEVGRTKRKMETVFTNGDAGKMVLDDAINFIGNEKLYRACSIPYKRNYLFYGKPGTGKTSVAFALASELNKDVRIIDAGHESLDFVARKMAFGKNTIFLFEDIDATEKKITTNRDGESEDEETNGDKLTLSQLLNLSDGLGTREGAICIFTTNHVENLDPALLRDGRMDVKVEFDNLDSETATRMVKTMTGIGVEECINGINPATLQEKVLQYRLGNINEKQLKDFCRGN